MIMSSTNLVQHEQCRSYLLGLSKVFVHILVKLHPPNISDRKYLLRPHLRSIQDIKIELVLARLWAHLNTEFPSKEYSHINDNVEILSMKIEILTS